METTGGPQNLNLNRTCGVALARFLNVALPDPPERREIFQHHGSMHTLGAQIITYIIWGDPYYSYGIVGPKTLF